MANTKNTSTRKPDPINFLVVTAIIELTLTFGFLLGASGNPAGETSQTIATARAQVSLVASLIPIAALLAFLVTWWFAHKHTPRLNHSPLKQQS
jgi:hypothetical protein